MGGCGREAASPCLTASLPACLHSHLPVPSVHHLPARPQRQGTGDVWLHRLRAPAQDRELRALLRRQEEGKTRRPLPTYLHPAGGLTRPPDCCCCGAADAQADRLELLQLGDADLHLQLQPQLPGQTRTHPPASLLLLAAPSLTLTRRHHCTTTRWMGVVCSGDRGERLGPAVQEQEGPQDHQRRPQRTTVPHMTMHLAATHQHHTITAGAAAADSHAGVGRSVCVRRALLATTRPAWRSAAPSTCRSSSTTTSRAGRQGERARGTAVQQPLAALSQASS